MQVPYCGWAYWLLYFASALVLLGCSYFQGTSLYRLQRGKDEAAIRQVPGDLHFDLATVHLFFGQTIVAGLVGGNHTTSDFAAHRRLFIIQMQYLCCPSLDTDVAITYACDCGSFRFAAGTVGIGSSLVIGPIMLMKGMLPVVCTAVNTALVLCSSSSASVKSLLGSAVPWDYCAFLFGLCFVCALIGKSIVDRMVRTHCHDSLEFPYARGNQRGGEVDASPFVVVVGLHATTIRLRSTTRIM